jgi:hypothetical protein
MPYCFVRSLLRFRQPVNSAALPVRDLTGGISYEK